MKETVVYKAAERDLGELIRSHGSAFVIEAKCFPNMRNGVLSQVGNATDYIASLVGGDRSILVAGGVAYVRTADEGIRIPDGLDFFLRSPMYREEKLTVAVHQALTHPALGDSERDILNRMLWAKRRRNVPLERFFNIYERRYWNRISEHTRGCSNGGEFLDDISRVRGLMLELYIAELFREKIPRGEISVRYPYPIRERTYSDIDVLVACRASDFKSALRGLTSYGIESTLSRDFTRKVRRREKRDRKLERSSLKVSLFAPSPK